MSDNTISKQFSQKTCTLISNHFPPVGLLILEIFHPERLLRTARLLETLVYKRSLDNLDSLDSQGMLDNQSSLDNQDCIVIFTARLAFNGIFGEKNPTDSKLLDRVNSMNPKYFIALTFLLTPLVQRLVNDSIDNLPLNFFENRYFCNFLNKYIFKKLQD